MAGQPKILFCLGARGPGAGETLASLRSRGLVTVAATQSVLDQRNDCEQLVGDSTGVISAADPEQLISRVVESGRGSFDAVLTVADDTVLLTAQLAAALGLPGLEPDGAVLFRDKLAQRARLAAAGLTTPRFAESRPGEPIDVPAPMIIKPARGSGGTLAFVITAAGQLEPVLYECRARTATAAAVDDDSAFIAEELIVGSRWHNRDGFASYVSVETAAVDGHRTTLAITDRFPLQPPVLETGMCLPTSLSPDQQNSITAVTEQALAALGFDHGLSHTELMLTSDGPVVIEVNARVGGALPYLFPLAGGPDLIALAADVALGREPEPPVLSGHAVSVVLQHPLGVDVLDVGGLDAIADLPAVRATVPLTGPGQSTRSLQDTIAAIALGQVEDPDSAIELHRHCYALFTPRYAGAVGTHGGPPEHYRRTPDGVVHPPHPALGADSTSVVRTGTHLRCG